MNIAIIGGSITEGAGANNYKNSYVYKLEQYFNEKYKDSVIKNLGAGGTASQFGLFRLKRDLNDFKPDLIFIEFGVNDRIYSVNDIGIYFEGLIRECSKITKKIIIIDFPKKFAYFYNLPVIDVQDEVFKRIGKREITWSEISIDNLHPNDNGHELYFEIIKENLDNINLDNIQSRLDDRTLSKYKFKNPSIKSYEECNFYGNWREKEVNLKDIEDGEHNLLMKLSEKSNDKSLGNEVIIGGFLVDEG